MLPVFVALVLAVPAPVPVLGPLPKELQVTLDGGVTVPVSRRYARALREAGWY